MPVRTVTVLADAGATVGLGHLSRAGAVAAALRSQGHAVTAVVQGDDPIEHDGVSWAPLGDREPPGDGPLVIDSYRADVPSLAAGRPVAAFWDGEGEPPEGVALTLTLDRADALRLACLRPMFWGVAAPVVAPVVRRVLVTMGGGAADVAAIAADVREAVPEAAVTAVLGPGATSDPPPGVAALRTPSRMVDELQAADLVVTAAGQTMLETLCAGTPCVATALAGNQRRQLGVVAAARGVAVAGGPGEVASAVGRLASAPQERHELAETGRRLIDGLGALRVAGMVARL